MDRPLRSDCDNRSTHRVTCAAGPSPAVSTPARVRRWCRKWSRVNP